MPIVRANKWCQVWTKVTAKTTRKFHSRRTLLGICTKSRWKAGEAQIRAIKEAHIRTTRASTVMSPQRCNQIRSLRLQCLLRVPTHYSLLAIPPNSIRLVFLSLIRSKLAHDHSNLTSKLRMKLAKKLKHSSRINLWNFSVKLTIRALLIITTTILSLSSIVIKSEGQSQTLINSFQKGLYRATIRCWCGQCRWIIARRRTATRVATWITVEWLPSRFTIYRSNQFQLLNDALLGEQQLTTTQLRLCQHISKTAILIQIIWVVVLLVSVRMLKIKPNSVRRRC